MYESSGDLVEMLIQIQLSGLDPGNLHSSKFPGDDAAVCLQTAF